MSVKSGLRGNVIRWLIGESGVLLAGFPCAVAVHSHKVEDDGVVHDAIDGRHRRHRVLEDPVPLRKHEAGGDSVESKVNKFSTTDSP